MKKPRHLSKTMRVSIASLLFVALVTVSYVSSFTQKEVKKAQADSLDIYPANCLGGWQSSQSAAGAPDGASAVLAGADAQLYCSMFQGGDQSRTPNSVTLNFSWMVTFGDDATSTVVSSSSTDASLWSSVLTATSSNNSESSTIDATTPPSVAPVDNSSDTTPDTSTDTSSDQSGTSFLAPLLSNPFAILIHRALADDNASGENFVNISYSLDGVNWQNLGQVNSADWQNYQVTIPITSWNDINNLQIELTPALSADAPSISVDAMWLHLGYADQSLFGALVDGTTAALNDVANVLNDILPSDNSDQSTTPPPATTPAPTPAPTPTVPVITTSTKYTFDIGSHTSVNVHGLSWIPQEDMKKYDASANAQNSSLPSVDTTASGTIMISGSCSSAYYTILLFSNQTDYESNPSAALFNSANACANGSFSRELTTSDFPPNLATGTYYMVIANQGMKGPWIPFPALYPISIGTMVATTTQ